MAKAECNGQVTHREGLVCPLAVLPPPLFQRIPRALDDLAMQIGRRLVLIQHQKLQQGDRHHRNMSRGMSPCCHASSWRQCSERT